MKPFQDIPVVPVKYGKKMGESLFANEFFEEKLDAFVDNLNLLYVAFTRAEEGLLVYGPASENSMKKVAGLIQSVCSGGDGAGKTKFSWSDYWDPETRTFTYGRIPDGRPPQPDIASVKLDSYPSWPGYARLRLRYQGGDYFSIDRMEKIQHGTILHELFERIGVASDVEKAVEAMVTAGKIREDERGQTMAYVQDLIRHPDVAPWFEDRWEIHNEAEILLPDGTTLRPDRLMVAENESILVDYKFGELKSAGHQNQVRNYKKYLRKMGHTQVRGYLWYVELGEVEEVEG
jgi:ATP-dependent exoDNAse (exonuclease V) beta subunit